MNRLGVKPGFAMDLGCAVGRSTFELARRFERVVGLDFSTRFIRFAVEVRPSGAVFRGLQRRLTAILPAQLQSRKSVQYLLNVEGDVTEPRQVSLESLGLASCVACCAFSAARRALAHASGSAQRGQALRLFPG